MDGFGVAEDILISSKDIIFRESGNCDPIISSKSSKSMESGSILPGIPLRASSQEPRSGVVFVFEKDSLVLAKVNKHNLDRSDYRPDIVLEDDVGLRWGTSRNIKLENKKDTETFTWKA
ncbi:ribosomal RNA small subunit methyltransferase nep-1 [Dorcoceras hygrometricum]|uniref:Ribosomal RNA small subunit methyltransferase nep-1 n=1 Tax=Dorcoceras hygrometricum TaxID=472368 RepID=A0A2Z7BJ21_9LAMI|nr:ribosomal RNA small subunit methyltransferase nep-1 [Dorcoceras hygrometricum]